MLKHELNEKGYEKVEKKMNNKLLRGLWAFFAVGSTLFAFFLAWFLFVNKQHNETRIIHNKHAYEGTFGKVLEFQKQNIMLYFAFMVIALLVYLVATRLLMMIFCKNKKKSNSMAIRVKDTITHIPTSYCREALKPWQFVFAYISSILIVYGSLFLYWFYTFQLATLASIFIIMLYISPDLVMVLYIIYIKITNRVAYISIEEHIIIHVYSKAELWDTIKRKR